MSDPNKNRLYEYFLCGSTKILVQEIQKIVIKYNHPLQSIIFNGLVFEKSYPFGRKTTPYSPHIEVLSLDAVESMHTYLQLITKIDRKYLYIENMIKEAFSFNNIFTEMRIPISVQASIGREYTMLYYTTKINKEAGNLCEFKKKHEKAFDIIAKEKALNLLI